MKKKIIIGSRGSKLALLYAQIAKDKILDNLNLNDEDIEIKAIITKGDQIKDIRLSESGGKGLFSTNIEKELQDKKIDIAVHALKDLPCIETKGLITDTFLNATIYNCLLIHVHVQRGRCRNRWSYRGRDAHDLHYPTLRTILWRCSRAGPPPLTPNRATRCSAL